MGKSTRFNLRYYRRRLEKQMPCEYVASAADALLGADLEALNASSLNPVPEEEFARRIRSASQLPGSFLAGLRGPDGRWLSLIGGWRQGKTTVLYWQMNSSGFEKHSIGTVMRSFFLEHEIRQGAEKLLIYGGTPHTMRNAFDQDTVADLVVRRTGMRAALLCWASRFFASPGSARGRSNFMASTLRDRDLQWTSNAVAARVKTRIAAKTTSAKAA